MVKVRLDNLLVEKGFCSSREKAKSLILSGRISNNSIVFSKPGCLVEESIELNIKEKPKFVSRGGDKLEGALIDFNYSVEKMTVLDVGSSTGGFTDCLLKRGAEKIYCVDVGYGQLAWSLRNDARVEVREKVNARFLKSGDFDVSFGLITMDVSFISVCKIIPSLYECLKENGDLILLIKPQFEAGKELVGKGGVVRDKKVIENVIIEVIDFAKATGFEYKQHVASKLKGPAGNQEYFLWVRKK